MKTMVTLVEHVYANKKYKPGDLFEAEDKDVKLLEGLGRGKIAIALNKNTYRRRDLRSEK